MTLGDFIATYAGRAYFHICIKIYDEIGNYQDENEIGEMTTGSCIMLSDEYKNKKIKEWCVSKSGEVYVYLEEN